VEKKSDKKVRLEWNVDWVNAPEVWDQYTTGEGTIYANADTGIQWDHPVLEGGYYGSHSNPANHNFAWWDGVKTPGQPGTGRCGINSQVPCDDNGHGTHTTGTGTAADGIGVSPGSVWIGCRNMDRGFGTPDFYMSCLNFFLAPHDLAGNYPTPTLRPHAVGNSYGCPRAEGCIDGDEFNEAVEALRAAGVFMSVSAGNAGPGCSSISDPPGTEESVISVAALGTRSNAIASYSSRGPVGTDVKPEISAPGSGVRSCTPGDSYSTYSGTSMASPHVAGAVTLVSAACPHLEYDVDAIQTLLQNTAVPLYTTQGCGNDQSTTRPNNVFGWGGLDVYAAVQQCAKKK